MNKFNLLVETVSEQVSDYYEFDENIAKLMMSLENDEITKQMTSEDWKNILKMCQSFKNIELLVAVLMCEDTPKDIRKEVYNFLPIDRKFEALKSEYIDEELYMSVLEHYMDYENDFYDVLKFEGHTFSNKVLNSLCMEEPRLLNFLEYLPFGFLKNNDMNGIIEEMLDSDGDAFYFEDGILPENFTSLIIANQHLSDDIKEQAFEKGYNPDFLMRELTYDNRLPEKIATEIYRSCADYIFDVEHDSKSEYEDADWMISKLINMKSLPLPCQIDFIHRQKSQPNIETKTLPTLLASDGTSSIIRKDALKINQKKIDQMVMVNKGKISEETLDELSKSIPPLNMIPTYMWSTTNFKISDIVAQKFTKTIDESAHRIALSSIFSERKTDESIIERCKNPQWKEEYNFIKDFKTIVKNTIYKPNQKAVMMYALDVIVDKNSPNLRYSDLQTDIAKIMFDIINEHKFDWLLMSNEEFKQFKAEMKDLTKQYSEYRDITDNLLERARENNKLYSILVKYPKLFSITTASLFSFDVVDKFDNKELYNLSEKELAGFTKDVKNINNKFLNNKVKTEIEDYIQWNIYNFPNKASVAIYKFADLYNTIVELKKDMSEKLTKNTKEEPER